MRSLIPDRHDEFARLYGEVDPILLDKLPESARYQYRALTSASKAIRQQAMIAGAAEVALESVLADIRGLLQADLFDSELDAARHLAGSGHLRASGAVAGVVLEGHLDSVCDGHGVKLGRKKRTISNLNDALKDAGIIDVPVWRHIQGLGDIRNLCDHKREREPTADEIQRLIAGTDQHIKELH